MHRVWRALFGTRREKDVRVRRHQRVTMNRDAVPARSGLQHREVCLVVAVVAKDCTPIVAALPDVKADARHEISPSIGHDLESKSKTRSRPWRAKSLGFSSGGPERRQNLRCRAFGSVGETANERSDLDLTLI